MFLNVSIESFYNVTVYWASGLKSEKMGFYS